MAGELSLVEDLQRHEGLADIARQVTWSVGCPPGELCGVTTEQGLGFLALRHESDRDDIRAVLSFSDLRTGDEWLPVPRTVTQVARVTGNDISLQNPHMTEKGYGNLGGVSAGSLASHYAVDTVAALRVIPVGGMADVFVDGERSLLSGIINHGRKWKGAELEDKGVSDETTMSGTMRVLDERARQLGGRACALIPLSSVNKIWQRLFIPPEEAERGHVLANGAARNPLGALIKIGIAPIPQAPRLIRRLASLPEPERP